MLRTYLITRTIGRGDNRVRVQFVRAQARDGSGRFLPLDRRLPSIDVRQPIGWRNFVATHHPRPL